MYIIGDIGNTEVKIFLINEKLKKIKKIVLKTNMINNKYLNKKFRHIIKIKQKIDKIIICSVVPKKYKVIDIFFKQKFKRKSKELKKINLEKSIKILANKKQIGSDRIANALSVMDKKNNYIIIDFGTATTFDVVKKNYYLGGIIAPGIELSLKNLIKKASLIPKLKFNKLKKVLGKNTKDAVKSGFYWGYIGLINNIIKLIIKDTKSKYRIILTGGLAHLFMNTIDYKCKIDKDVTLKGLIKLI
tara:strand:+ start:5159 stop:5893 length:735 start_codon:yes stop_codon:yes gene_type:complete